MQPVERKRQGYIHELMETEERYVDDLQLVVEVRAPRALPAAQGVGPRSKVSPLTKEFSGSDGSAHTLRMLPLTLGEALKISSRPFLQIR